jgi:hypothetical protein
MALTAVTWNAAGMPVFSDLTHHAFKLKSPPAGTSSESDRSDSDSESLAPWHRDWQPARPARRPGPAWRPFKRRVRSLVASFNGQVTQPE